MSNMNRYIHMTNRSLFTQWTVSVLDAPIVEAEAPEESETDNEVESSEEDRHPEHPFDRLENDHDPDGMLSELESTLLILDWMTSQKATEESVKDIHLMLKVERPDSIVPIYHTIRGILKRCRKRIMQRIE